MPDEIQPNDDANWLELLESVKSGDREALAWLLRNYWKPLCDEARSGLAGQKEQGNQNSSKSEFVQETLIDVKNSLDDFSGQTPKEFKAWLQTILTKNLRETWRANHTSERQPEESRRRDQAILDQIDSPVTCRPEESKLSSINSPQSEDKDRPVTETSPRDYAGKSVEDDTEFRPSNRYQLISRLGQGGFGIVFLARDQQLNRNVALKMPRPDLLLTKSMVQRFLREARNVAKLDHPNIVPVLATDETAFMPSIVYPYCSGPTLGAWLHSRPAPPDYRVVAKIVQLLAEAVQHAHARGILHRDLKLANVLLEPMTECDQHYCFNDGESSWIPRVTDFGISKATEAVDNETLTGSVMGTLEYMAPEQIRGLTNDIGSHSDVYSLGVILYELLAKQRPYSGDSGADVILKMKDAGPPLLRKLRPEIPRDLEAIVTRCLSVSIHQRYVSAAGLAEDLGNFLESRPVLARKNSIAVRTARWIRRQPVVAALSGVCAVLAFIAIAGTISYLQHVNHSVSALSEVNKQLESHATELRNQLYAADINAAARAFEDGDLPNYDLLLSRQIKATPEEDVRELAWYYLWNKGHRERESIAVSKKPLYSVQFSNCGNKVALCGEEGVVSIYDAQTRQKIISWNAEQGEVNLASFSPDDRLIATAGDDGTICIWDSQTAKLVSRFRAHPLQAFHSLFGNGDTLVSCGNENVIRVWNWKTGEAIAELNAHTKSVQSIAISKDRTELYSASDDGTRAIWDLANLRLTRRLGEFSSRALDVQPAIGFPFIFSGDLEGNVRRESMTLTAEVPNISIAKVTDSAVSIAVSSDSRRVAVATRTGMISVIELDENLNPLDMSGDLPQMSWSAHSGRIYDLAFSADDSTLSSVGHDGTLRIWKMEEKLHHASVDVTQIFEPMGNGPVVFQIDTDACVFSTGRSVSLWRPPAPLTASMATTEKTITRLVGSTSKKMVFAGSYGGRLDAWWLKDNKLEPAWNFNWQNATRSVTGLAYNENRNWIASAIESPTNRVILIDAETGKEFKELSIPRGVEGNNDGDLAFSPDGKWLAAAINKEVVLWNLDAIDDVKRLSGHSSTVTAINFHPNSTLLATGSSDRAVKIWNVSRAAEAADLRRHTDGVTSVLFSPDGKSLLSSDRTGCTAVWHTDSGRFLLEMDQHKRVVNLSGNWFGPVLFRSVEFSAVQADFVQMGAEN